MPGTRPGMTGWTASREKRSASVTFFLRLRSLVGLRGCRLLQPVLQLRLDLRQFVRVGLEIARMRPLEARLEHTADAPIGVAQMIVDGRIFRLQLDRAFELLHRLVIVAELVIGPAERI